MPLLALVAALGCGAGDGAPTGPRSIEIALSAPSAAVQRGEAATARITLLRHGVSGDAIPSVEGLPAGVLATFSPGAFTESTDRLIVTFHASPTAPLSTSTVKVRVDAGGAVAEAPLALVVRATGGSTNFVALAFCREDLPAWFAYQNEGEQWVSIASDADGSFVFSGTNRIGLAWVGLGTDETRLSVVYTTVAELSPRNAVPCLPTRGGSNVSGTFSGLESSVGIVSMAHAFDYNQSGAAVPRFALTSLPERALDLVAIRADVNRRADAIPNRVLVRRRVNPLTTPTTSIDFATDEALVPVTAPLQLDNLAADTLVLHVTYRTANGTEGPLQHLTTATAPAIYGVPPVLQAPSDVHVLSLAAYGTPGAQRGAYLYLHSLATSRVMLGAALAPPEVALMDSVPYARWRLQLPVQAEYGRAAVAAFGQTGHVATVAVTAGYAGAAATWDVVMPDLARVPGWSDAWGLVAGQPTAWAATALSGTSPLFGGTPPSGTVERLATRWSTASATTIALVRGGAALLPFR